MKRAACVLIERRGKYLAISSPQKRRGWSLPGGKSERAEPSWTTAVRECEEETGLKVESLVELYRGWDKDTLVFTFFATARGRVRSSSEGRVSFVSKQALLDGAYPRYNRAVFDALKALRHSDV